MKFPGVVAVLCVIPSGLVLHIGITSCTFPPWTEMSKKNNYENYHAAAMLDLKRGWTGINNELKINYAF